MHNIVLWKWKQPGFRVGYTAEHVNVMADMILRHKHDLPVRIVVVTDDATGIDTTKCDIHPLWQDHGKLINRSGERLPSCYRRLKLFDTATQNAMRISKGQRIVSLDLDMLVTNDMRPMLRKTERFVGWAVRGTHHMRVFNGSMWMFTAGEYENVWSAFHPDSTPEKCYRAGYLGSDQSWLSYNFAKDTTCGTWAYPQLVSYPREVQKRPLLSKGTAVVSFHGRRKPWEPDVHRETPWTKVHYRLGTDPIDEKLLHVVVGPANQRVRIYKGVSNAASATR